MRKILSAAPFFLFGAIATGACVSDDLGDFSTCETITYSADVGPIITTKCALSGCHNGGTLDWTNFNSLRDRALSGKLKQVIQAHDMPPPSSGIELSQSEMNAIICWADQGAPNN